MRGLNSPDIRKRNRSSILRLIHRHGGLARNELAKALGLTRASITYLINELIEDGLVEEGGSAGDEDRTGRRKVAIRIRERAGLLLGVAAELERLQLAVTDLRGAVLYSKDLPSPAEPWRSGQEAARALADRVAMALRALVPAAVRSELIGAGFVLTGRVDSDEGTSLREPRLWSGPVPLKGALEAALGLPVAIDNNVRALALAELLLTGRRAEAPLGTLFVKYGPGVGGAWLAGGEPWPGAHYRSGELGHTIVAETGELCPYCGRRGCLESLVSARALGEALGARGARAEELCARLEANDGEAFRLLASRFALALGNAIEICDPALVTLYGAPFLAGTLFDQVAARVEANERPCEIRRSELDPELPALGGVALALDHFFLSQR